MPSEERVASALHGCGVSQVSRVELTSRKPALSWLVGWLVGRLIVWVVGWLLVCWLVENSVRCVPHFLHFRASLVKKSDNYTIITHEMAHAGHFLAVLGPAPALTAFGGAFSIDHNDGQVYRTMCG